MADTANLFIRTNKRKRTNAPRPINPCRATKMVKRTDVAPPAPVAIEPPALNLAQLMELAQASLLLQSLQVKLQMEQYQLQLNELEEKERARQREEQQRVTRSLLDDLLTKCVRIEKVFK